MKSWMTTSILFLFSVFFLVGCSEITENQVVLSYENEDMSMVIIDTVEKGTKVDEPNDLSRIGYEFIAWYYDKTFENEVMWPLEMNDDVLLYPKYQLIDYNISYELNGGENNPLNPLVFNVEMDNFQFLNAYKTDYGFIGWYTDDTYAQTRVKDIFSLPKENITLYARWQETKLTDGAVNFSYIEELQNLEILPDLDQRINTYQTQDYSLSTIGKQTLSTAIDSEQTTIEINPDLVTSNQRSWMRRFIEDDLPNYKQTVDHYEQYIEDIMYQLFDPDSAKYVGDMLYDIYYLVPMYGGKTYIKIEKMNTHDNGINIYLFNSDPAEEDPLVIVSRYIDQNSEQVTIMKYTIGSSKSGDFWISYALKNIGNNHFELHEIYEFLNVETAFITGHHTEFIFSSEGFKVNRVVTSKELNESEQIVYQVGFLIHEKNLDGTGYEIQNDLFYTYYPNYEDPNQLVTFNLEWDEIYLSPFLIENITSVSVEEGYMDYVIKQINIGEDHFENNFGDVYVMNDQFDNFDKYVVDINNRYINLNMLDFITYLESLGVEFIIDLTSMTSTLSDIVNSYQSYEAFTIHPFIDDKQNTYEYMMSKYFFNHDDIAIQHSLLPEN